MIALEVFVKDKFVTFRESLVYFKFRIVFTVRHVFLYLLHCCASRQPITSVEFKFVARRVVASAVIRATKLKFVAESKTRVYFAQHVASTCNTVFAARQVGHKSGNTRNNVFQLAMQQFCETSQTKILPVLPDLYSKSWFPSHTRKS